MTESRIKMKKKKKESDGVGATYQGRKEERIRRDVDQINVLATDSELLMVFLFHWGKKKQDDLLRECRKELYATIGFENHHFYIFVGPCSLGFLNCESPCNIIWLLIICWFWWCVGLCFGFILATFVLSIIYLCFLTCGQAEELSGVLLFCHLLVVLHRIFPSYN